MPVRRGVLTSGQFGGFGLLRDAQHAEHLVLEQRHQLALLLQELRHVVVEGIVLDLVRVRVRVRVRIRVRVTVRVRVRVRLGLGLVSSSTCSGFGLG